MKRAFIVLVLSIFFYGCATIPTTDKIAYWQREGSKSVTCNAGKDCEIKWDKCIKWVKANSKWEIKKISDFIIATDGPFDSPSSAFSITKEKNQDGTYTINFEGWCGNSFGCSPDERKLKAQFVNYVNGT
jgi:hypothetical protein